MERQLSLIDEATNSQCPSQSLITPPDRRQRLLSQTRQQFVPHQIQNGLQIAHATGDGDDSVLFARTTQNWPCAPSAAKCAVAGSARTDNRIPDPNRSLGYCRCNLNDRRRLTHDSGTSSCPATCLLQIELSKNARCLLCEYSIQNRRRDSFGTFFPGGIGNAHGSKIRGAGNPATTCQCLFDNWPRACRSPVCCRRNVFRA